AQPQYLIRRHIERLHRQLGKNIDRVGDDKKLSAGLMTCFLDTGEDLLEQRYVPIDKIQSRLVWLPPQTSCNYEDIAILRTIIVSRVYSLVSIDTRAVEQIKSLAFSHVRIGVKELNLWNDTSALQSK